MISEFFNIAFKNIKKRKLRAALTLVGITIAVATIFILISASLGLEEAVQEQFRLLGTDKFFIQPRGQLAGPGSGGAVELSQIDVDTVEKVSGVKKISFWTLANAKIEVNDEIRYTSVIAIDLETADLYLETGAYTAEDGRVLKEGDEGDIMIGSQYKHNNFFSKPVALGDTILVNDQQEFKIRGILNPIGNPGDDRLIYMPFEDFRPLFNITTRVDMIIVQVEDESALREVAERAEKRLRSSRDVTEKTQDFTILTPEELLESFGVVLNIITGFLLGVAAISLLVGAIGIANTTYTSVLERTREIGVMKAIGAKNKDILSIFVIESGLLGLVGGVLGVFLGIVVAKSLEYIAVNQLGTTLLRATIPFWLVIGSLAFAFLVGSLSGLWPAWKATKIKPVEALRYE